MSERFRSPTLTPLCSACTKRVSLAEPDPEPLLWLVVLISLWGIFTLSAQMDLAPWVLGVGRTFWSLFGDVIEKVVLTGLCFFKFLIFFEKFAFLGRTF